MRRRKRDKIARILDEFKGLEFVGKIRDNGKKHNLTSVVDADGVDFGADADDALSAEMVSTLTGGGNADALHEHAAGGAGGAGCMTAWGRTSCPADFTLFYAGEAVQGFARQQNDGSPETISVALGDTLCVDPLGLPEARTYSVSYFVVGLMQLSGARIHDGPETVSCAVCCR